MSSEPIKCRAAVVWQVNEPFKIDEITVDPPKAGEVRVKIVATGICHSDLSAISGRITSVKFPLVIGHEAAGIVESIGEGVESVKPGDHVITLFLPQCRKCSICLSKNSNSCMMMQGGAAQGLMSDGTSRMTCRGEKLMTFAGTGTFAEYTVLNEVNVAKVDPKVPLEQVCLLSCGIPTGYGAAINTAGVTEGSSVAIWGLGTIGLAAVMGCKNAGAKTIIGIDKNPSKFKLAEELGATDFINPTELSVPLARHLRQQFNGGVDFTIECIGQVETMTQAFESCSFANGVCVLVGIAGTEDKLTLSPKSFTFGRTLKGSVFGSYKSRDAIPQLVEDMMSGKLNVNKFVTHEITLDDINEGFELLKSGKSIRTIIKF